MQVEIEVNTLRPLEPDLEYTSVGKWRSGDFNNPRTAAFFFRRWFFICKTSKLATFKKEGRYRDEETAACYIGWKAFFRGFR